MLWQWIAGQSPVYALKVQRDLSASRPMDDHTEDGSNEGEQHAEPAL